jgi:hypothetical protein
MNNLNRYYFGHTALAASNSASTANETQPSKDSHMAGNLKSRKSVGTRRDDRSQYRLICGAAFIICLPAAAIDVVLPRKWRLLPQSVDSNRSVYHQARATAHTAAAFAMMGY